MNAQFSKIVILGGGESGVGAAILAQKKGYNVFLSDKGSLSSEHRAELQALKIPFEEGSHTLDKILEATTIIKSPGIPNTAPIIEEALRKGISILSEIEFASQHTSAKLICITGSNGKTTTTSLVYHIFKQAKKRVRVAGNIGQSFAREVAQNLDVEWYVLELSSFQLENIYSMKADIAILLNITPDHMDRYDHSMQKYTDAKMRIIQNQTPQDAFIYWADDPIIAKEISRLHPKAKLYPFAQTEQPNAVAYVSNRQIIINLPECNFSMEQDFLALTGTHNLYNSLAAGIAAKIADISNQDLKASLSDFKGVEHRLEKVARVNNVLFINDSKATNINSCQYALESIQSRIVLILGGLDKGNNYQEIEHLIRQKVKALVFLGKDNSILEQFFAGKIAHIASTHNMKDAVQQAFLWAEPGDTVILSPCCASFDLFKNFEDRGNQFKACVRSL